MLEPLVILVLKWYFSLVSDEEETTQLRPITLTRQHKGAIRAIRKVRVICQNLL